MITHDPRVVRRSCTRVLFVERGRIVVDSPVPQAFAQLRKLGHAAYTSAELGDVVVV
jgi:ABC-type methionine transport system ATPase subunit